MKMYILIPNDISIGMAVNSAAHASLKCHLKYQHDPEYQDWLNNSFKKVTCSVTAYDFEMVKQVNDYVIVTESNLYDKEVAIAFKPRKEYPAIFKTFDLYGK